MPDAAAHEPHLFVAGRALRDQPAAGYFVIARGQIKANHADGFSFPAKMITQSLVNVLLKLLTSANPISFGVAAKQSSAGEYSHGF